MTITRGRAPSRSVGPGELAQDRDHRLPPAEVEAGARLVEEEQLGLGHEHPGHEHPLALALGERAELLGRVPRAAHELEQLVGARVLGVVVGRPPRLERGVGAGEHGIVRGQRRAQLLEQRAAGEPDASSARGGRRPRRSVSPSTVTVPRDGARRNDRSRRIDVLPDPLGPSTTHRSSARAVQSRSRSTTEPCSTSCTPASTNAARARTVSSPLDHARCAEHRRSPGRRETWGTVGWWLTSTRS